MRESIDSLTARMKETTESLSASIAENKEQAIEAQGSLRRDILDQSKKLSEEIRANQEAMLSMLDRRYRELRGVKVDRAALAEFLTEVALRLNDEFRMPDAEG